MRASRRQVSICAAAHSGQQYDYDLVIIGCGVGGHGAALHAVECVRCRVPPPCDMWCTTEVLAMVVKTSITASEGPLECSCCRWSLACDCAQMQMVSAILAAMSTCLLND